MAAAVEDSPQARLDPIFQPVAPNHPIVISCVNGGFAVDYQENNQLNEDERMRDQLDQRRSNFFIPPFAPVNQISTLLLAMFSRFTGFYPKGTYSIG
jgi:hypothetical protein